MYLPSNIQDLLKLRSDTSAQWSSDVKGRAPHKPLLLLSILDGIEQGWITENRIVLDDNLISTFFGYWNGIFENEKKTTIALPFFHMKSEPFWELVFKNSELAFSENPSIKRINDRIAYASIDSVLFNTLSDSASRLKIQEILIDEYFSAKAGLKIKEISSFNTSAYKYSADIKKMVAEPFIINHEKRKVPKKLQSVRIRNAGFSITVRKAYNYFCAVCRNKVITPEGQSLVEGAHIIPWNLSNNDDPRNGLSLCKSHHWLYDSLMITVRDDYSVEISPWLEKDGNSLDFQSIKEKQIIMPEDKNLRPSTIALDHHYERFISYHKNN